MIPKDFRKLSSSVKMPTPHQRQVQVDRLQPAAQKSASCSQVESRVSEKPVCPHCKHEKVSRWGFTNGLQRYRCCACRATFNALTASGAAKPANAASPNSRPLCRSAETGQETLRTSCWRRLIRSTSARCSSRSWRLMSSCAPMGQSLRQPSPKRWASPTAPSIWQPASVSLRGSIMSRMSMPTTVD